MCGGGGSVLCWVMIMVEIGSWGADVRVRVRYYIVQNIHNIL